MKKPAKLTGTKPSASATPVTLDKALAEFEAKKQQAAKYQVKHAKEIAAFREKDADKQKRLNALTVEERRKVLDAAGLHHVSAAAAPLTRVRHSGPLPTQHPASNVQGPNWNEWQNTPHLKIYEACALSLGIEPHAITFTGNDWMAGPGHLSSFKNEGFPNDETKKEFELRQRVLWANLDDSNSHLKNFPSVVIHRANPSVSTVALAEFSAWAASIVKWENLPSELLGLAHDTEQKVAPDAQAPAIVEQIETRTRRRENHDIAASARPGKQQVWQECKILKAIASRNCDAKALPKPLPGKAGVKAEIRKDFNWIGGVFDKAWQRLRDKGDISDAKPIQKHTKPATAAGKLK